MKSLNVSLLELMQVVDLDRREGKGRFGLRYVPAVEGERGGDENAGKGRGSEADTPGGGGKSGQTEEEETENETGRVISLLLQADQPGKLDLTRFSIRATQGHSLHISDTESLLTPVTLESDNVPETVVHGTFYGAWNAILASGGLKAMGRMYVHLATGPALGEVLPGVVEGAEGNGNGRAEKNLVENRVRSGMRSDAQILVYVDVRRAIRGGIKFWVSENGVVLTEGVPGPEGEQIGGRRTDPPEKLLPLEFFDTVVEIKRGLGVLWRDGKVVKELPKELASMAVPRGKGGGGRGGGTGVRGRGRGRGQGRGGGGGGGGGGAGENGSGRS